MSARTYYFGGIALFLFGIQVVTGTLLSLYYKPTPETAYESVQFITSDVSFGWLIRAIHHWAANLMILFVALHLVRVFIQGAYKYPRELTWVVGSACCSWCARVRLHRLPAAVGPAGLLGDGRSAPRSPAASRSSAARSCCCCAAAPTSPAHVEPLLRDPRPGAAAGARGAAGFISCSSTSSVSPTRKRPEPRVPTATPSSEPLRPFFPNYLLDELVAWYVLLAILVVLASLFPVGLEEQADPLVTPRTSSPSGTTSASMSC